VPLDKPACPAYKGARREGGSLLPIAAHSLWFSTGEIVRQKKPLDPVRQAQKNRAYRIGYLIALVGILCGFALLKLKSM